MFMEKAFLNTISKCGDLNQPRQWSRFEEWAGLSEQEKGLTESDFTLLNLNPDHSSSLLSLAVSMFEGATLQIPPQ